MSSWDVNEPFGLMDLPITRKFLLDTIESSENNNKHWSFKSASFDDIEWEDIVDSLSYKNPLALITRSFKGGKEFFIAVNDKLITKAALVGIETPDFSESAFENVFELNSANEFAKWVDWAKHVKKAEWPFGEKSLVDITLPTI
jgi:hypothetical protein